MEIRIWFEENFHQVALTLSVARSHRVRQHLQQSLSFLDICFLRPLLLFLLFWCFYDSRDPLVFLFFLFRCDWLTVHKSQTSKIAVASLNHHLLLFSCWDTRF